MTINEMKDAIEWVFVFGVLAFESFIVFGLVIAVPMGAFLWVRDLLK